MTKFILSTVENKIYILARSFHVKIVKSSLVTSISCVQLHYQLGEHKVTDQGDHHHLHCHQHLGGNPHDHWDVGHPSFNYKLKYCCHKEFSFQINLHKFRYDMYLFSTRGNQRFTNYLSMNYRVPLIPRA